MTTGQLLDLGSDLALRYRYFTRESMAHPAKLHLGLLAWLLERYTRPGDTIADPMAGIGSTAYAALLQRHVILREIEPKWLALAHENAAQILRLAGMFAGSIQVGQGDAREPWGYTADHIVFSPPYGCAASTTPNQRRCLPYALARARNLTYDERWRKLATSPTAGAAGAVVFHYGQHPAQIGHLRSAAYWTAMTAVYAQALTSLRSGGSMILVIKDHIRDGQRVRVADQTVDRLAALGFHLIDRHARRVWPLSLWQRRRKERGEPVVEEEDVLVFRGAK